MKLYFVILVCTAGAVALMLLGLGVKMLVRKNGQFKRHCSGMDPYTGENSGCVCGKAAHAQCKRPERYSPLEVNEEMMNEIK